MSAAQDKASIKSFMSSLFSAYHSTANAQNATIYATKNEVAQSLGSVSYPNATTTQSGLMSASDKSKLNNLASITSAGSNINIANGQISATYPNATTTQSGLMSASDKASLNAIPTTYATNRIATTSQNGLMSAQDKASLDNVVSQSTFTTNDVSTISSYNATTDTLPKASLKSFMSSLFSAYHGIISQSLGGGTSGAISADSLSSHLNYSSISAQNCSVSLHGSTIKGSHTISGSTTFTGFPTITGNPRFTGNVYFYITENSSVDSAKVYFGNATVNGTNTTFTGNPTITGNPRFTGKVYYNNHVYLYTSATDDDGDNPTVNGAIVHMSNSSVAASGATIKGNPKFTGNPQFLGDPRFNNDVYFYTIGDNEVYTGAELHMGYATISGSPTINGSNFYMKNATLSGNGISVTSAVKFNDSVVCAQRVTLNSGLDLTGSIVNSNLTLTAGTSPNSADICHINYPNIALDNGPIIYMPNSSVRAAGSTVVGNPLFSEGLRLGTVSSANNGSIWYSTSNHKLMLVTGNATYTFSPDT